MSRINPLRRLYNSLSEQLSEDDERSLRNLLHGDQLTTRDLEHLNSPAEIFIKLEESGHISKTDFVLLKELLQAIKRLPLVAEVENVEKHLQESNESKIKSTGCVGAEGGNVAASSAADIEERGKMMMSMTQDLDGNSTSIHHGIDKDYTYNSSSSLATGLQQEISLQGHISSTERKEDLPQDVKDDQLINSAASTSIKSTHKDVILKCQETLRKEYKRLSHILPLPWLDGADSRLKLEDIYTELDLQSSDGTEQILQREDIFSCSDDDENPKRILIEGEPGYGKSTFCKMIAYEWAKITTEYLRNFKLLFLLELKDLQDYHSENKGKESLKDFIFNLVLRDIKEREALWSFIENNQSQVCFIFDGLDEVSSSNPPSYFKQMVRQKWPLLPECHVIVTSRIIRDCDSKHMYDKKLSIKGLGREKVELFVKKYLKYQGSIGKADEIGFVERFMLEVKKTLSPQILYSLMQSPLNTLMLCEIWKQNRKVPQFITEIYKTIVEYMVKRYCENSTEDHTLNDTEMKETLIFLGKKSLEALSPERCQVSLSNDEIKSHPHVLKLGFLSKSSTSLKGFKFFHQTFQEYFAALYTADLCSTNPSGFADIIDISGGFSRHYNKPALVFLAGLLKDKQSKIFEAWYRKIDITFNSFDPTFILQESGFVTPEIISLCAKVLPDPLPIEIADLENHVNKSKFEITQLLLQCSDIRSDTVCIKVSASNPNAGEVYSTCRVCLKANSKKIKVEVEIDCELSKCAVKHHLNDLALASDPYTNDIVSLHIRNHDDSDMLHSIPNILDVFQKINAKTHIITGLPLSPNLIDVVLLKLNYARSLHSVQIVFDEQKNAYRSGTQHTRAVQITSKVGKCKICCNIIDVNFDLVTFQRLLECFTSGTGDRVALNIKLRCDFRIEAIHTYVENILHRMTSVNIDELTLKLESLNQSKLDIEKICPQIATIMKRVSSISARTLIIKGFPVESLELIEKVHAHLSGNKSLNSIHVVFAQSSKTYKVHIDAKFGKFNVRYENPFIGFDLVSFHQLLLQYASLNHTAVILNFRVTCAGNAICMSNIHDIIRRMESVPIDRLAFEFSENAMANLADVCSRLIGIVQALSLISARELVITGLPVGNIEFIAKIHKVIVNSKQLGSVRIKFQEHAAKIRQNNLEITAKVGSLESSFKMNDLNLDLSKLQQWLSELTCVVSFNVSIKCDFRESDVGSYIKNLYSKFKSVVIHIMSLFVFGYAYSDTKDADLCINNIMNGFEDVSAEQLNVYIRGSIDDYGHINFITMLCERLHNNTTLTKVCIEFTVHPRPEPCKGESIHIIADFGMFRIAYNLYHLKFELQSLYQSLSNQASLQNDKVTLYITIFCDLRDRALKSYMKDMTVNMKAVNIAQITFNIFSFTTENANRIQNILTSIAQVRMQTLLVLGIPFDNLGVLKIMSEPFRKLIPNIDCFFLSRLTCPTYCKLNLLQHSSLIVYCKTSQINLRICKDSCGLVSFYQRFLQICLPDESGVKIEAHVSYGGNRQQANSDIQYLLAGNKFLRFGQLSFLDGCNYNKLSVEGSDTRDVLKTVVAMNTEIIRYENCPSSNLEFAKSVLDIMLRSRSSKVVMSFREKINSSRILDTIKSFENDGFEIHFLQMTSRRILVHGNYIKSPMSAKDVKLVFATGHSINNDYPSDRADTYPFRERDDVPVSLLRFYGIDIENDDETIEQSQTRALTLSMLRQYVSALTFVTDVSFLDGDVIPEQNIKQHLTGIMTHDSLETITFRGCNLNKIDKLFIDCIKKTDKTRKSPLKIGLCHALDSTNISMLKDALETDGFVYPTYFSLSDGKKTTGWRGKRVEIILIPCNQDNASHNIEPHPLVRTELTWLAFDDMHNRRNDYIPFMYRDF